MFDPNVRILIVDDMLTMRKLIINCCRELGFLNFIEAGDGAAAWEKIDSASPPIGLIVSDWNMPHATGLDLLKKVRGDARFQALPFVMVTAESEKHQIDQAVKAGVSSYVIKPFNAPTLAQKLEEVYKQLEA